MNNKTISRQHWNVKSTPDMHTKQSVLTDEPYYEPIADEIAVFAVAYQNQLPVLLKRPTGCGNLRTQPLRARTGFSNTPIGGISIRTRSPDLRKRGGRILFYEAKDWHNRFMMWSSEGRLITS